MKLSKRTQRKNNQKIAYDINTREQNDNKIKAELETKRRKRMKLRKINIEQATKEMLKIFE